MKQLCEHIQDLSYTLRIIGVTCEGPAHVYGGNHPVLANTTTPDSTLKKKPSSLACHLTREGVAMDDRRTSYVNDHDNKAD